MPTAWSPQRPSMSQRRSSASRGSAWATWTGRSGIGPGRRGAGGEQAGGQAVQNAEVAGGVLGERRDELRGHEPGGARRGAGVAEHVGQLLGRGAIEEEPDADATGQRQGDGGGGRLDGAGG